MFQKLFRTLELVAKGLVLNHPVQSHCRGVGTGPADPAAAGPIFCQNPQSKVFGY